MKPINERFIKISQSKIVVDKDFNNGDEIKILVTGDITKVEYPDNQDGTEDKVGILKGLFAEIL